MRLWLSVFFIPSIAMLCSPIRAQVVGSSNGDVSRVWVGAEYANFNPDWGIPRLPGLGIYANINLYKRFGVEGEARFFTFTKPGGLTEKSYLIGPNVNIYNYGRFSANLRFVAGAGLVTYTRGIGYGSYFEFAPAGNLEYRIAQKWKVRFDYEHQWMTSAPGLAGYPDHGLTPRGYSGGVSYRVR